MQVFCQHEVDLETYVLIGERSWTCAQSTITPGVHLTFKIAGLKKVAVSKVLENLDKPDKHERTVSTSFRISCDKSV